MNILQDLFSENTIEILGWTVVHSLWQGTALALLLGGFLYLTRQSKGAIRYLVANVALLLTLVLPVITFFILQKGMREDAAAMAAMSGEALQPAIYAGAMPVLEWVERNLSLIVQVWFVGFLLVLIRVVGGYAYLYNLKTTGLCEPPAHVSEKLQLIRDKLGLRKMVRVMSSVKVNAPAVIGHIKPVILIPLGIVNGLNDKEVEAILAHELAHVARHDYLFNLVQTVIEAILYYHPAVWWISSQIRNLREHCCDDLAIRVCGDEFTYARSLVRLEELRQATMPERRYALSFLGSNGKLLERVKRILQQPQKNVFNMEKIIFSALLLIVFIGVSAFSDRTEETPEESEAPEAIETLEPLETELSFVVTADTSPVRKKIIEEKITVEEDGARYEATFRDGKLDALVIDGETIPSSRYDEHRETIDQLEHELQSVDRQQELEYRMNWTGNISVDPGEVHQVIIRRGDNVLRGKSFSFDLGDEESDIQVISGRDGEGNITIEIIGDEEGEPFHIQLDGDDMNYFKHNYRFDGDRNYLFFGEDGEELKIAVPEMNFDWKNKADDNVIILRESLEHLKDNLHFQEQQLRSIDEKKLREMEFKIRDNIIVLEEKLRDSGLEEEEARRIQEQVQRKLEHQQRILEKSQEVIERAQGKKSEQMQRAMEEYQREMEEYQREMEDARENSVYFTTPEHKGTVGVYTYRNKGGDLDDRLEAEMLRDGLIDNRNNYSLKLTGNKLKVNGKRVSDKLYEKYARIYERVTGKDIDDGKYRIQKKDEN